MGESKIEMDNILAAKVLMSHVNEIADGAYKTATKIAIETLFSDALRDWDRFYSDQLTAHEYLGLSKEDYCYWLLASERG